MKKNLLTVIVPVYNLESYISTCIESLLNQSYKDFKIIVIDDCSMDKSLEILLNYSKQYQNIKVLHNDINQGVSYCRNLGLSIVETKYVAFLDGDDWLDYNCYEQALISLESNNNIDLVLWNINTVYSRSSMIKRYFYDTPNVVSNTYALSLFTRSHNSNIYLSPLLGNKVIRTKLIQENKLYFKGSYYEDDIFIFYTLLYSTKVQIQTDGNLYYLQRDDSLMHSFSSENIIEFFNSFVELKNNLKEIGCWNEVVVFYYALFERCLKNLFILIGNASCTTQEERNYILEIMEAFYSNISLSEYMQYCDLNLFLTS